MRALELDDTHGRYIDALPATTPAVTDRQPALAG